MKNYPIHKQQWYSPPSLMSFIITNACITFVLILTCVLYMHSVIKDANDETRAMINELSSEVEELNLAVSESATETVVTMLDTSALPELLFTEEITTQRMRYTIREEWDYTSIDITNISNATEEEFAQIASDIVSYRNVQNDDMLHIGSALVEVEKRYGISGTAILSIITWESGFGEDCANTNNVGGIRISSESYASFNSVNECILYMGELLHSYVNSHGLTSWEDIGERYCDNTWSEKVTRTLSSYNEDLNEIMYKNITSASIP